MKKIVLFSISFLVISHISAQKIIKSTNEFVIEGLIEKNIVINIKSLLSYPTIRFDSIVITNHLGEIKSTMKNVVATSVKNILNDLAIKVESPKQLSEFYFVFEAVDNYKVVFSWNEIFNTKTGQDIYVIIERDGKKIENLEDRISVISPMDFMTGRRFVKSLSKIIIKRVE